MNKKQCAVRIVAGMVKSLNGELVQFDDMSQTYHEPDERTPTFRLSNEATFRVCVCKYCGCVYKEEAK